MNSNQPQPQSVSDNRFLNNNNDNDNNNNNKSFQLSNAALLSSRSSNRSPSSYTYESINPSISLFNSQSSQPIGTGLASLAGAMSEQPLMRSALCTIETDTKPLGFGMDLTFDSPNLIQKQQMTENTTIRSQTQLGNEKLFDSITDQQLEISNQLSEPEIIPNVMESAFAFQMTMNDDQLKNAKTIQQYASEVVFHSINKLKMTMDMTLNPKQKIIVAVYSKQISAVLHVKFYKIPNYQSSLICEIQRRESCPIDFFNTVFKKIQENCATIVQLTSSTYSLNGPRKTDRIISFDQHLENEDEQYWFQILNKTREEQALIKESNRLIVKNTIINLIEDARSTNNSIDKRAEAVAHLCDLFDSDEAVQQTYELLIDPNTQISTQFQLLSMFNSLFNSLDRTILRLSAVLIQYLLNSNSLQIRQTFKQSNLSGQLHKAQIRIDELLKNENQSLAEQQCLYNESIRQLKNAESLLI